ncbi:MAG TPA: hypothetical protein VLF63_01795 [Patescibacteria group bacterium]|nr:hypothetical protein [Patescibacteria group bacterium]
MAVNSAFILLAPRIKKLLSITLLLSVIFQVLFFPLVSAFGLSHRSLEILNNAPSVSTDYIFTFNITTTSTIGSMSLLFCSNTPIQGDICDIPSGFDVTNAQLTNQSGITDFTLFVNATNSVILSRPPSTITAPLIVSFTLHNVTNPNSFGPYYARLATYSSTNATGSPIEFAGVAFYINSNLQITSVVPPYLNFCSAVVIPNLNCSQSRGDFIDFGQLLPSRSSQSTSQLLVATNASNGYVIQIYGTTMTSGNNIIPAIYNTASSPGSSQFGVNLVANSVPLIGSNPQGPGTGQPTVNYANFNHFSFNANDIIAGSPNSDNYREYTVSYLVNISKNQAPGVYDSTMTYVATPNF